jgi:hypothetical protein
LGLSSAIHPAGTELSSSERSASGSADKAEKTAIPSEPIDLRLLFKRGPDLITFVFSGNHDDVQAYLKNTQ